METRAPEALPLALSVDQAAWLLSVHKASIYRAVKSGEIVSVRIGRRLRIPTDPFLSRFGIDATSERAAQLLNAARRSS